MTVSRVSSAKNAATVNSGSVTLQMPGSSAGNLLVLWGVTVATGSNWSCDNGLGAPDFVSQRTSITMGVWVRSITSALVGALLTLSNDTPLHRPAAGCIVYGNQSGLDGNGVANGLSTSVDCPSVTPSKDHDAAVTIGAIQSATDRSAGWGGWTGSGLVVAGGNGSGGAGGVEFAAFDKLDLGATSGTATGVLSETSTPQNGWAGITLLIGPSGATVTHLSAVLAAQAQLVVALAGSTPGATPIAKYAKANATWGLLSTFNATDGSAWN